MQYPQRRHKPNERHFGEAQVSSYNGARTGLGKPYSRIAKRQAPTKTSAKAGMPHKYKTIMCKNVENGVDCPFGKSCNYAHSASELRADLEAQKQACLLECEPVEPKPVTQEHEQARSDVNLKTDKAALIRE